MAEFSPLRTLAISTRGFWTSLVHRNYFFDVDNLVLDSGELSLEVDDGIVLLTVPEQLVLLIDNGWALVLES